MTAATFYGAMVAWLALNGLTNFKLSGVMELHKTAGLRQYSASLVPDRRSNSTIEEPEAFEHIFRNGSPIGFVLVDVTTGQFYSEHVISKPNWRIQLTYIRANETNEKLSESQVDRPRRSYERPLVELANGAVKMEPTSFPPRLLQARLKYLIKLKEKHLGH